MADSFIDRLGFDDYGPKTQEEIIQGKKPNKNENFAHPFGAWYNEYESLQSFGDMGEVVGEVVAKTVKDLYTQYLPRFLIYPSDFTKNSYQTLFLKMDVFTSRKKGRQADETIYLPMPSGLLRSESGLIYDFDEQNISGEFGKVAGEFLADYLPSKSTLMSMAKETFSKNKIFDNTFEKLVNTYVEQNIQEGQNKLFEQIRMGAGYEQRKNFTKIFLGIDKLRNFRVQWKLYPKSYTDAKTIETIFRELQISALPEISDMSFLDEFGYNTFVERSPDYVLGGNNDQNDYYRSSQDVTKKTEFDHKFYSSTYRVPKELELTIVERVDGRNTEVKNIVNFPSPFVIDDITIQIGGEESEADTFLKEGSEYFNASYLLLMGFRETVFFTADDVEQPETYFYKKKE